MHTIKTPFMLALTFAAMVVFIGACTGEKPQEAGYSLETALKVHGGLERFRSYKTLEYDFTGMSHGTSPGTPETEHHTIDLQNRRVLISNSAFTLGFDGSRAWITPDAAALGVPARFYATTPFYFFAMPFVFADPGCSHEYLGSKTFGEKQYHAVRFTYDPGVGDTSRDNYVAYFDSETHLLALVHYIVTYPAFIGDADPATLPRHVIVFESWQESSGLTVPHEISFYEWKGGALGKKLPMTPSYINVSFTQKGLDKNSFTMPEGGVVDGSLGPD